MTTAHLGKEATRYGYIVVCVCVFVSPHKWVVEDKTGKVVWGNNMKSLRMQRVLGISEDFDFEHICFN